MVCPAGKALRRVAAVEPNRFNQQKKAARNQAALFCCGYAMFYQPDPGVVGTFEAAALSLVDRKSIEAAVNAVTPAFFIASLRVILSPPMVVFFISLFIFNVPSVKLIAG